MILCIAAFILAQSADDVVAKAIVARGGIKRIKSLNSQRLTGRISLASGESGPLVVEMKRPGMMREMVTLGDKSMIRTTDGIVGWAVGSLRDLTETKEVSLGELLRTLAASAELEGLLDRLSSEG